MTTDTEWKKIKGYNNFVVSNEGIIRNVKLNKVKAQRKTKTGYVIVDLKENGKKETRYVHRIVAEVFVDNPHKLPCINHKDEDKSNNNYLNLEWCTVKYNNNYGSRVERVSSTKRGKSLSDEHKENLKRARQGEKHWNYGNSWSEEYKRNNLISQPKRIQIRNVDTGEVFKSIREASKVTGINKTSISHCVKGKQKTAGGFKWEVI